MTSQQQKSIVAIERVVDGDMCLFSPKELCSSCHAKLNFLQQFSQLCASCKNSINRTPFLAIACNPQDMSEYNKCFANPIQTSFKPFDDDNDKNIDDDDERNKIFFISSDEEN